MLTRFWCWLFGHSMWAFVVDLDKDGRPIPSGAYNAISGNPGFVGRMVRQSHCSVCGHEDDLEASSRKVQRFIEEMNELLPGAGSWADQTRALQAELASAERHIEQVDAALELHPPSEGEDRRAAQITRIEAVVRAANEHWTPRGAASASAPEPGDTP